MTSDSKKEEKVETKKYRVYFMLALWLSINLIWLTLHQQPSVNQVNNPEIKINYNHTVEIPNILSRDKPVPFSLRCDFTLSDEGKIDNPANNSVSLILFEENEVLYGWYGNVGDVCPTWNSQLPPGSYLLQTSITSDPKSVDVTVEYDLSVFRNFSLEGFYVANLLGLLLVLSEIPLFRKNKNKGVSEKGKKWKPQEWQIGDATKEVEVGLLDAYDNEETIISDDMAKQRKQYEDEIQNNKQDLIQEIEKTPMKQPDELQEGDDSTMKGKLRADERIQRVSDIYDLMEDK